MSVAASASASACRAMTGDAVFLTSLLRHEASSSSSSSSSSSAVMIQRRMLATTPTTMTTTTTTTTMTTTTAAAAAKTTRAPRSSCRTNDSFCQCHPFLLGNSYSSFSSSTSTSMTTSLQRLSIMSKGGDGRKVGGAAIATTATAALSLSLFAMMMMTTTTTTTTKVGDDDDVDDDFRQNGSFHPSYCLSNFLRQDFSRMCRDTLLMKIKDFSSSITPSKMSKTQAEATLVGDGALSSSSATSSSNFQVVNAMEVQDEIRRVRLAKLLHDLHELARHTATSATTNKADAKRRATERGKNLLKYVTRHLTRPPTAQTSVEERTGKLTFRAARLSPAVAADPSATTTTTTGGKSGGSTKSQASHNNHPHSQEGLPQEGMRHAPHLRAEQARELIEALRKGGHFDTKSLLSLLAVSSAYLKSDPTLVDLRGRADDVVVVGDLHGSIASLTRVLELVEPCFGGDAPDDEDDDDDEDKQQRNNTILVFNGDFVDRGTESLEVLCTLLILKLTYPDRVVLLRGNHEDHLISSVYGFRDELMDKYGEDDLDPLWDGLDGVFCALPLAARTECAAILHGGIPSGDFRLDSIRSISTEERCRIRCTMNPRTGAEQIVSDLLWSDPSSQDGIRPNTNRGCGVFFGPDEADRFLRNHGLTYLVRAHELAEDGTKVQKCGGNGHGHAADTTAAATTTTTKSQAGRQLRRHDQNRHHHHHHDDDGAPSEEGGGAAGGGLGGGCRRAVITVFSAAAYPNGLGHNVGALVHLDRDGGVHTMKYSHRPPDHGNRHSSSSSSAAAAAAASTAGTAAGATGGAAAAEADDPYAEALHAQIAQHKFRLHQSFQFAAGFWGGDWVTPEQWADVMGRAMDLPHVPWALLEPSLVPPHVQRGIEGRDGGGDGNIRNHEKRMINWREFLKLYCGDDAGDLSHNHGDVNMELLYANHVMLLTVFKFLDVDGNGMLDEREFRQGVSLLNKRLPEDRRIDADKLFRMLDLDGNGIVDLDEFAKSFSL